MAKRLVGAAAAAKKCKGTKGKMAFRRCVRKHAKKGKKGKR